MPLGHEIGKNCPKNIKKLSTTQVSNLKASLKDVLGPSMQDDYLNLLENGSVDELINFTSAYGGNTEASHVKVLAEGTVQQALEFQKRVQGADFTLTQDKVLEEGTARDIIGLVNKYKYNDADLDLCADRLIEIGALNDLRDLVTTAQGVGEPLEKTAAIQEKVLQEGDEQDLWNYGWNVEGADLERFAEALLAKGFPDLHKHFIDRLNK